MLFKVFASIQKKYMGMNGRWRKKTTYIHAYIRLPHFLALLGLRRLLAPPMLAHPMNAAFLLSTRLKH